MSPSEGILAFVHIEKAAGTSTHQILKRWFGTRYCPVERWGLQDEYFSAADLRWLRLLYPRLQAIGGHWIKPWGDLERTTRLRWWTILREPLARCASHYQYQIRQMGRSESFEHWIRRDAYRNFQTRKLVGREDADAAIRLLEERFLLVGLAERFDESMLLLRRALGGGDRWVLAPTLENVAQDDAIKSGLLERPESRALLEEANRADQRVYDHVVREMVPRQRERWGEGLEAELEALRLRAREPGLDLRRRLADLKRYALYKPVLFAVRRLR